MVSWNLHKNVKQFLVFVGLILISVFWGILIGFFPKVVEGLFVVTLVAYVLYFMWITAGLFIHD